MIDLATTTRINIRIDEFAALFGVSRRTVYNWRKAGHLDFVYIGGACRIPIQEVRALAAGTKTIPTLHRKLCHPVHVQATAS